MASGTDPSSVSLPGGTGLTGGMGESFRLDLNTGQGVYSLPIKLPKGVAGHSPSLRLEYSAARGNGPYGMGWDMPIRAVHRRLDYGVPFGETGPAQFGERFYDDDVEIHRLADGSFAPLVETAFNRYQRIGDGWVITERNGVRHELGTTAASRVADPDHPDRVVSWLLDRTLDTSGNEISYQYVVPAGSLATRVLHQIDYAAYRVVINHEDRPDLLRDGRAGFLRTVAHRVNNVEVSHVDGAALRPIRSWALSYEVDPVGGASLLTQVVGKGHGPDGTVELPPVTLSYLDFDPTAIQMTVMDNQASGPPDLSNPDTALVCMDDTARPGVLQVSDGTHVYWPNLDGRTLGSPRILRDAPNVAALSTSGAQLLDLDGNGTSDLMVAAGPSALHGYYPNRGSSGWGPFVHYPRGAGAEPPWREGGRPVDFNGDGLVDALAPVGRSIGQWENEGRDGWSSPVVRRAPLTPEGRAVDLADPLVRLADMTGDGLLDLVEIRSGAVRYWPALGHGRFGAAVTMTESPRLAGASEDPGGVLLLDLSGDGCADLVRIADSSLEVWTNRHGVGFGPSSGPRTVLPVLGGSVRVAALGGDTRASVVWSTLRHGATPVVGVTVGQPHAYRLRSVDNGQGLISEIEYGSSIEEAERDFLAGERATGSLPFALSVVTKTSDTDISSGRNTEVRYQYHDGHFDPVLRLFQGFARVEKIEVGDASRPDRTSIHHFATNQGILALNRLTEKVEVRGVGDDGLPLSYRLEESQYESALLDPTETGIERRFVFVERSIVSWPDGTTDTRTEAKSYTYDNFANVVREETRATGQRAGQPVGAEGWIIETEYAHNDGAHIHDKPARVVRRTLGGDLLGEIRLRYDGPAFAGLAVGQVTRGLTASREQLVMLRDEFDGHYQNLQPVDLGYTVDDTVDGDEAVFVRSDRAEFDGRGLQVASMDELGVITTQDYGADGLFVVAKTGPLGTEEVEHDHGSGEPTRVVDADDTEVKMSYDGLGRLVRVVMPGDTEAKPTRAYQYLSDAVPNSIEVVYRRSATETMKLVAYLDGSGQEVQRRVEHDTNQVVVSGWNVVNAFGDVVEEYEPTFADDFDFARPDLVGRPHRTFEFDAEGRALVTTNYNGAAAVATIAPFELTTANAVQLSAGVARRDELDVRHRRMAVHEPTDGGVLTTRYELGEMGELTAVDDQHGTLVRYSYDRLGQRLSVAHRDAGTRQLFRDASGRVFRTIDGEGNSINATFDDAGRILTLATNSVVTETYTYDPDHPGGLGRLDQVTYPGGSKSYTYTPRGQVQQLSQRVVDLVDPLVVAYEFDGFGNEIAIVHPDSTRVETEYYANGWVKSVPNFVTEMTYDPRGLAQTIEYDNGVETTFGYTAGIGRVLTQRTINAAGSVHDDLSYTYDQLERVATTTDVRRGTVTTTGYNLLAQLASYDDGTDVFAYRYDGRDLIENGEAKTTLRYENVLQRGLLTGIEIDGGGVQALASDANGSLLALPGRQFSYNAKGELAGVTAGTTTAEYVYDHSGDRVRKVVQEGATTTDTIFVGDRSEVRGPLTVIHISVGPQRIALRSGANTRWIHSDYLGSGRFFTDQGGSRIDGITIRPFGNVAGNAVAVSPHMFAMHPFDAEAGLHYARRRYYAPELGRWLTADGLYLQKPETDQGDPRTLALYTYVANDPVNYVDPSGQSFWTVLGGIVGVIVGVVVAALVIAAFATGIGFGILALVGVMALVGVGYAAAAAVDPTSAGGQFLQGMLIGFNAGLNGTFGMMLFGPIGIALGVINFLAVFDEIRTNSVYQGILGWSNFVQPMSWLITGLGLLFFVLNLIGHVVFWISGGNATFFEVKGFHVDWATGTFGVEGGWVANLNTIDTAYNMGNFVFIDQNATNVNATFQHEIGHSLNLAVFGSAFHLAGFVHEMGTAAGAGALSELMAEDHVPGTGRAHLAGWWI